MALLQPEKLLPTSTAGSLPKPSWLAEPEKLWSAWKLEGEELLEAKRDALMNINIGITYLTDVYLKSAAHFFSFLAKRVQDSVSLRIGN